MEEDSRHPEDGEDGGETGRVVDFPEEESVLSAFLRTSPGRPTAMPTRCSRSRARIPRSAAWRSSFGHRPGAPEPRPDPQAPKPEPPPRPAAPGLARTYGKGLKGMRLRTVLVFLLAAAACSSWLFPASGFYWLPRWAAIRSRSGSPPDCLAWGRFSLDMLWAGLRRASGAGGDGHLAALSVLFTLADADPLPLPGPGGAAALCSRRLAGLFSCPRQLPALRPAPVLPHRRLGGGALSHPGRGQMEWTGHLLQWSGVPNGFGARSRWMTAPSASTGVVCPLLLLACLLFSLLASYGLDKPQHLLWCLSATFLRRLWRGLVYGRPFHKLARRLASSGAALAGWPGTASPEGDRILLTDGDLFPRLCGAQRHQGIRRLVH